MGINVDGGDHGRWQQQIAPEDADPERTITHNMGI